MNTKIKISFLVVGIMLAATVLVVCFKSGRAKKAEGLPYPPSEITQAVGWGDKPLVEPEEGDYTPDFVEKCKERAEAGDAEGAAFYGRALLAGWAVVSNHTAAVKWLQKAADASDSVGLTSLGECYLHGAGVKQDAEKGINLIKAAAAKGLPRAQFLLGYSYVHEASAMQEKLEREWNKKHRKPSQKELKYRAAKTELLGLKRRQGMNLMEAAAEHGCAMAQLHMGLMWYHGIGVPYVDTDRAYNYWVCAARQRDISALGIICQLASGGNVQNNTEMAKLAKLCSARIEAIKAEPHLKARRMKCEEYEANARMKEEEIAKAAEEKRKDEAAQLAAFLGGTDASWTKDDTEKFWSVVAAYSTRQSLEQRISPGSDQKKGEGMLEEFGMRFMPNAYDYYQKCREKALERIQIFHENFPNGKASDADLKLFGKIKLALVKAVSECDRRHDELCHYYLLHKAGIVSETQLADVDSAKICIMLPPVKSILPTQYSPDSAIMLAESERTFASKYMPETLSAYDRLYDSLKSEENKLIELRKDALALDAARSYYAISLLESQSHGTHFLIKRLNKEIKEKMLMHSVEEITADDCARKDQELGSAAAKFEKTAGEKTSRLFLMMWDSLCLALARTEAPLFFLKSDMVPIPGTNYAMCKYETTIALWKVVMGNDPSKWVQKYSLGDNCPITSVSWDDVQKFLTTLNALPEIKASGLVYRLPTVDEWKDACLAGGTGNYMKLADGEEATDDSLLDLAYFNDNSSKMVRDGYHLFEFHVPHAVGGKKPNFYGLHDMLGNVAEWVSSWRRGSLKAGRLFCGGHYNSSKDKFNVNSWRFLDSNDSNKSEDYVGFRLVGEMAEHVETRRLEAQRILAKLDADMVLIPNKEYRLCRYEVTQELWDAVMGENLSEFKGARRPVENISYDECLVFIKALNECPEVKKRGRVYRLPTEKEWQFACRAGADGEYCRAEDGTEITKESLGEIAWIEANSGKGSHVVGQKIPNSFGLHDMLGNVKEWVSNSEYGDVTACGGFWGSMNPSASDHRSNVLRGTYNNEIGFRLACGK